MDAESAPAKTVSLDSVSSNFNSDNFSQSFSPKEPEDKGVIGLGSLVIITINSVFGTGIFFLPAVGAAKSGSVSLISWVIMGLYAMGMAAAFAELASMFSFEGGVYEYCKEAFGHFTSFIIGWMTLISTYITIAMLVVGAINYLLPLGGVDFVSIFGLKIPPKYVVIAICLFFIFVFNYVAYLGMKTGTVMLVTFGIWTLGTLFALIVPSWKHGLQPLNFQPFEPSFGAVLMTLFFIAETFFGWETICVLSPQVKNKKRNVPLGLIIGTLCIVIITFIYTISAMNGVGAERFGSFKTPISDLGRAYYGPSGYDLFTILCYVSIIGSVAGWIVSSPGFISTLAKDKMFPAQLAELHPVKKTPYKAIILQTIVISVWTFLAAGSFEELLIVLLPIVLVMYSFVVLAVLVLRRTKPELERGFKLPFANISGVLLIITNIGMVVYWAMHEHGATQIIRFVISLIVLGIPLYFLLNMYYDPDSIRSAHDKGAFLAVLTESIFIPSSIKKELFEIVGDLYDKEVLEYGCGVGTITMEIARRVGQHKKVYAVHLSEKELAITHKRIKKKGHEHVILIHDEHQVARIHPDVGHVDVIISFGMLSYMQNVENLLQEMNKKLRRGGKICFIDYVDFFKILPNNNWLSDPQKIEELFQKAGLSVHIIKKKGMLWNYLFIYGVKTGEQDTLFI